jgi:NAD(P)H dehydrogenase (quinone)
MNVLIVYAHPEEKSFNAAMKNIAQKVLESQGHQVQISDLYKMNFKAVADRSDFLGVLDSDFFNYIKEQFHASKTQTFAKDIEDEQNKIRWADFILFQFPLWWTDAPAILKGWFDRVFAYKFAYGPGRYEEGLLKGKKAMLSITTGGGPEEYGEDARKGPIMERLFSIHHEKLFYCGMDVLTPFVAWGPQGKTPEERERLLCDYAKRMEELESIPLLRLSLVSKK